jgi:exodeoxyribonuclease-5
MLSADFVIIDEASMLKDDMIAEINQWKKKGAKIIYMGDRAQLPPVGQSSDSKVFGYSNHYLLTEKMRQAATSPIIGIGTVVSDNVKSKDPQVNVITSDMMVNAKDSVSGSELLWEQNEENALKQFVEDVKNNNDTNHAKIVTFNNERNSSGQSVLNLNMKVRQLLYGLDSVKNQFMVGERLMAYDTFGEEAPQFTNGEDLIVTASKKRTDVPIRLSVNSKDKGYRSKEIILDVEYLDLMNEEGEERWSIPVVANSSVVKYNQELDLLFKTDPQLAYALKSEFGNLEYGYAITSHKAQGSTYTNTYVMLDNILGNTNLGTPKAKNQSLYVAVSRPSTKLVMVTKTAPIDPKSITVGAEKSKYDNDKIGC